LPSIGFNAEFAHFEVEVMSSMKLVKKIALWISAVLLGLAGAFVTLHTYYRFTPVALSAEANALLAETAHMTQLTDNAYRMHGLLAPEGVDALAYGKCYAQTWKKYSEARQSPSFASGELSAAPPSDDYDKQLAETLKNCSQDKPRLPDLKTPADADRIRPGFDMSRLASAAANAPSPIYFDRWNAVLRGGVRGTDPDPITAVFPMYTVPLQIERARLARFAAAWVASESDSQRAKAFDEIEAYLPQLVGFADGTLIESMIAAAATSQYLLVIQAAATKSELIDSSLSQRMQTSFESIERLPQALANSIGAEIQAMNSINQRVAKNGMGEELNGFANALGRFAFDANETLNLNAVGYRESQRQVQDVGLLDSPESAMRKFAENLGCPWLGDLSLICTAFERNATGRALATIAMPAFTEYGKRIHDVRNLAAATRLTIDARRQGFQGDALVKFVASAPEDMRDVYTQKQFAYDAVRRKLTVDLRTRSTVLGEKSYELDL
jgi:hypothetical protein